MSLRSILNAAWVLALENLEPKDAEALTEWLNTPTETPLQLAEKERKRKARENREGIANLSAAFNLGG